MIACRRLVLLSAVVFTIGAMPVGYAQEPRFGPPMEQPSTSGSGTDRRLLELLERLNQLEREIRQLRSDVETVQHAVDGMKRRQRELYLDLDRRLREVELGSVRAAREEGTAEESAQGQGAEAGAGGERTAPTESAAAKAQVRRQYERAFNLLKEGRYAEAGTAFRAFLKEHPQSGYSDNAQYWLGETNYVSRNYEVAVTEFETVLERFPESPKVPDAMLKLGFSQYELQRWQQARSTLEKVVERYPESTAARLARTRLTRMKKEGR